MIYFECLCSGSGLRWNLWIVQNCSQPSGWSRSLWNQILCILWAHFQNEGSQRQMPFRTIVTVKMSVFRANIVIKEEKCPLSANRNALFAAVSYNKPLLLYQYENCLQLYLMALFVCVHDSKWSMSILSTHTNTRVENFLMRNCGIKKS